MGRQENRHMLVTISLAACRYVDFLNTASALSR
jgi:hypothetical protein